MVASPTKPSKPIPVSVVKGRRKSIIRIKPKNEVEEQKINIDHGDSPFTEPQLVAVWKQYSESMKKSLGGFSSSIIANCEPKLMDDSKTVHLIFRNETNELEFGKMSSSLLDYLKSNLKNNHIEFSTEVSKVKAKKLLYTNKDKFVHLSKLHPKLIDWEQKLGLELK